VAVEELTSTHLGTEEMEGILMGWTLLILMVMHQPVVELKLPVDPRVKSALQGHSAWAPPVILQTVGREEVGMAGAVLTISDVAVARAIPLGY
jgi:hypothetical protein